MNPKIKSAALGIALALVAIAIYNKVPQVKRLLGGE